jgi:hypothetical protein
MVSVREKVKMWEQMGRCPRSVAPLEHGHKDQQRNSSSETAGLKDVSYPTTETSVDKTEKQSKKPINSDFKSVKDLHDSLRSIGSGDDDDDTDDRIPIFRSDSMSDDEDGYDANEEESHLQLFSTTKNELSHVCLGYGSEEFSKLINQMCLTTLQNTAHPSRRENKEDRHIRGPLSLAIAPFKTQKNRADHHNNGQMTKLNRQRERSLRRSSNNKKTVGTILAFLPELRANNCGVRPRATKMSRRLYSVCQVPPSIPEDRSVVSVKSWKTTV